LVVFCFFCSVVEAFCSVVVVSAPAWWSSVSSALSWWSSAPAWWSSASSALP
ncbi:hypothetical protein M9458_028686, partial [Cirrhinus mrigala]